MKYKKLLFQDATPNRTPVFKLTPADGAIGSHANAVQEAYKDFIMLEKKISTLVGLDK